jgi:hypothetical protein
MSSKYIRLKSILLNAIKQDLDNNDYDNEDLSVYKKWHKWNKEGLTIKDKYYFQFAFKKYQIEVGGFESIEYWLSGLALPIPYWNEDIENLGLYPKTYFNDLAYTLKKEVE